MSGIKYTSGKSGSEYSMIYSDMHGVDLTGDGSNISKNRFAYLENMYRDYDNGNADTLESIPGYRKIFDTEDEVYGLFHHKYEDGSDALAVHSGDKLYLIPTEADSAEPTLIYTGLNRCRSSSFFAGNSLYVIDGKRIVRICGANASDAVTEAYIPMLAVNYEDLEQRNLYTRSFKESYTVGGIDDICYGSEGICYAVTDADNAFCKVTGYTGTDTSVYIPARTKIGDKLYTVKEIDVYAFSEKPIEECFIAGGVERIGNLAFYQCSALQKVTLSDSVTEIGNAAFSHCVSLTELHMGLGMRVIGNVPFALCTKLDTVTYSGTEADFSEIINTSALGQREILYEIANTRAVIGIRMINPAVSVSAVHVGDIHFPFEEIKHGALTYAVRLCAERREEFEGKEIVISATLSSSPEDYRDKHFGFCASVLPEGYAPSDAINKCTVAANYDGRIFLTGNPDFPGICFFSGYGRDGENDPLYFGDMNYFLCGGGAAANTAMLPLSDSLAIFKERQDGDGSIFYHSAQATDSPLVPRIYPKVYSHSGVVSRGAAVCFFDDPVFVSEVGIAALDKNMMSADRHVSVRSHNVNPLLLTEVPEDISLDVWRGYLVAAVNGHIYLADSRDKFRHAIGGTEYEWYYLSGIGAYRGDERVYRYSEVSHEGFSTHRDIGARARGEILSTAVGTETVYYTEEDGVRYEVYPTEELIGGEFYPLTRVKVIEKRLYFASSDGSISVFNNDMCGAFPEPLLPEGGIDQAEYSRDHKNRLHPYYYSFSGHAPRYALKTARDNCGIPHMQKDTVRGSMTMKCRAIGRGGLTVESTDGTDGYSEIVRFPNSSLSFWGMDFNNLSLLCGDTFTLPIGECRKKWVEKQISVYTEEPFSPFGIYNIAYRFKIKGRIKK